MKEYADMSKDELSRELTKLQDDLEEVTEEREMMLFGTTGLHRSVAHLVEKYASELGDLNAKIQTVTNLLKERE